MRFGVNLTTGRQYLTGWVAMWRGRSIQGGPLPRQQLPLDAHTLRKALQFGGPGQRLKGREHLGLGECCPQDLCGNVHPVRATIVPW